MDPMENSLAGLVTKVTKNPNQLILVVIKGRYPFITDLAGLDLSDCVSILLENAIYAEKLPPEQLRHFDFVQYFDAGGEFWKSDDSLHISELEFIDLVRCMDGLMADLSRCGGGGATGDLDVVHRVRLVTTEEYFVRVVAKLRERYGIDGPKLNDIHPFTDKACMKRIASQGGLPTAKYALVSPKELKRGGRVDRLEASIGYPMLVKPLDAGGAAGIEKIHNRSQLVEWIDNYPRPDVTNLVEEYIDGTEYRSLILVQESGISFFPTVPTYWSPTIFECLRNGEPLCMGVETNPRVRAIVEEFARDAVSIYRPMPGSSLFIQSIMTKQGDMKLIELACRVPGLIASKVFQENSGISPESAHITAQVCGPDVDVMEHLSNSAKATRKEKQRGGGGVGGNYFAKMAYPMKEGKVRALLPFSTLRRTLESEIEVQYCVKPGDETKKAPSITFMGVRIDLWHDNADTLRRECLWIMDNYDPIVMEDDDD